MDSLTIRNNIDNGTKKEVFISPFRANKEQAKKTHEPIIRGLSIIKPDDSLLARLRIKDENDSEYQSVKYMMDTDYQILRGEVEINGVVFNLFLVIGKDERIFTQEVLRNSNLSQEEQEEYLRGGYISYFEKYVLRCFEDLSRVDSEILEIIRNECNPDIVFKTKTAYDYRAFVKPNWGAYVSYGSPRSARRTTNINFYYEKGSAIVHEFGHLFDHACNITSGRGKDEWNTLSQKYSAALKLTTRCGNYLSGYTEKDYQNDVGEFFADLFYAYYIGDRVKEGAYLVELLDKDALDALEREIGTQTYNLQTKDIDLDYRLLICPNIDKMIVDFDNANDKELANLISNFISLCDNQIYIVNINVTKSTHVNTVMYSYIIPMLKRLISIYDKYKKEPTKENRDLIKDAVLSFTKEINDYSNLELNIDKNTYKDISIVKEDDISTTKDKTRSSLNKTTALLKLMAITNHLFSPYASFPKEFCDEIIEKKNEIQQQIMKLSEDGLTDIEFKVIINSIHNIVDSILTFNPVNFRVRLIRKKLLNFYEEITNLLKADSRNRIYKEYQYLLERMMEFFENEEMFKNFNVESDIFMAMMAFEKRLDQHMKIPADRLRRGGYKDLENFFDFVHESLELDGYQRNY